MFLNRLFDLWAISFSALMKSLTKTVLILTFIMKQRRKSFGRGGVVTYAGKPVRWRRKKRVK